MSDTTVAASVTSDIQKIVAIVQDILSTTALEVEGRADSGSESHKQHFEQIWAECQACLQRLRVGLKTLAASPPTENESSALKSHQPAWAWYLLSTI